MKTRRLNVLRVALIVIGAAMVMAGLMRGEGNTVFQKAYTVCLECIGIG